MVVVKTCLNKECVGDRKFKLQSEFIEEQSQDIAKHHFTTSKWPMTLNLNLGNQYGATSRVMGERYAVFDQNTFNWNVFIIFIQRFNHIKANCVTFTFQS